VKNKVFLLIVIFSVLTRFILLFINNHNPSFLSFHFLQDNYINYAQSLQNHSLGYLNNINARLFPGYPLLMLSITTIFSISLVSSGLIINFLSLILSIIIFWQLTKSKVSTVLFSLIPPIWFIAPLKIATEPLTVFLLLLSIYLFFKKNYFLTGIVLGLSSGTRLISICLFLALIIFSYAKNKKTFLQILVSFSITFSLFFIYNFFIFNDLFYQFKLYPKIGGSAGSSIAFIQIINDILRSIDWHQYRILFSGIVHILFSLTATYILFRYRNKSSLIKICFLWSLISLIFIFSYGPNPLIEEFRRFIIPFLPALILGIMAPIKIYKKNFIKILKYVKKI
jgi:hypothetical protein